MTRNEATHNSYFHTLNASMVIEHHDTITDPHTSSEQLEQLPDVALFHAHTAVDCGAHCAARSLRKFAIKVYYIAELRA